MRKYSRVFAVLAGLVALVVTPAAAQEVHEIRMVAEGKGEFRFVPASVSARRGDVLLFKALRGAPHSVVFEAKELSAQARERLNAALPRRAGDLSSPLLTEGSEYRIVVPQGLAAGTYRFYCLPHRAYDMRGELSVK
jgi:plastocyanin